jgi:hypothetical protein
MQDEDLLDGCGEILDSREYDDDETAALRPLFPEGQADAQLAEFWRALASAGEG